MAGTDFQLRQIEALPEHVHAHDDPIEYRGDWVHDQAPILAGIGESYNRHTNRWHAVHGTDGSEIGHQLSVGGGDPSETTVESVLSDSTAATTAFLELAAVVLEEYVA